MLSPGCHSKGSGIAGAAAQAASSRTPSISTAAEALTTLNAADGTLSVLGGACAAAVETVRTAQRGSADSAMASVRRGSMEVSSEALIAKYSARARKVDDSGGSGPGGARRSSQTRVRVIVATRFDVG